MPHERIQHFPFQKLPQSKKTKKWAEECIEAAEDLAIFRYSGIRETYKNKLINYNLANDILDTSDLEKVCNPMGIRGANFPAKMQNYPIANPKIDLLVGEERKRKFDWHVRVVNDDAVTAKEDEKKKQILEFVKEKVFKDNPEGAQVHAQLQQMQQAQQQQQQQQQGQGQGQQQGSPQQPQQPQGPPQGQGQGQMQLPQTEQQALAELEEGLKNLDQYLHYEFQDTRERMASHILNYLFKNLNLKEAFSRGFEDALIAGEEIYCADIVGGEPVLRKCNPLNVHTVRSGESPFIDEADIIVEDGYHSPGQVIDLYYDWLTSAEVKEIDEGIAGRESDGMINIGERENSLVIDGIIDTADFHNKPYGEYWDTEGNVRVTRVVWKSFKKMGVLTYFDEGGMPQETQVDEDYPVNKDKGETVKWLWINQWWEGTRIAKNIYVKVQVRPVQFRSMTNLSKCSSGYTGMAYNINSSRAKSLMDRMKPYQYLYNVFMYRTELAFAKDKGRIGSLDLASIPDHWDVDKWMYYAEIHGWAVKDSFKEANKGAAQGKLAGQMQQNAPVLDMSVGNQIQQNIMMLQFIENQMGEIAGVTKQREGQIENRELVGNVERAVTQSSHITEKWFALHNNVKRRALELLLETAKFTFKTQQDKRVQYVLDDMSTSILAMDGAQFNECDYGIIISDGSTDAELLGTMKQLAQAGLQNDKINFSQLMDIHLTPSMADMRRKIQRFEGEKAQRDQQQQQMMQQMEQQKMQIEMQLQGEQRKFELVKLQKEYEYKMEIEKLRALASLEKQSKDLDNDGIPDVVEVDKIESVERMKQKELELKAAIESQKLEIERAKLNLEDKKIQLLPTEADKERKSKEKIARQKPKATAK